MTTTEQPSVDEVTIARGFQPWRVVAALATVPLTMAVLALFAGVWWVAELVSHFRFHIAVCLVLAVVVFACARRWAWLLVSLVAIGLQLPWIGPYLWWGGAAASSPDLRVAVVNVYTGNHDHAAVVEWIRAEEPDVVVILEIDARWAAALAEGLPEWSAGKTVARPDNFGIALLARRALSAVAVVELTAAGAPSISAEMVVAGRRCRIVGTHPLPPMGLERSSERDAHLAALPDLLADAGPQVVLGDLNCTPGSPVFARLCADAGLRDSARGFGWQPTWPSGFGLLGLPIDHCLVSSEWRVLDRRVGPPVGSDHRPVVVDLAIE